MDKIPTSLIGYKKSAVHEILKQKDNLVHAQKKDISYLRSEISRLEKRVKKFDKNK